MDINKLLQVSEIVYKHPEELSFILDSKTYEDYVKTYDTVPEAFIMIPRDEFNLVKRNFKNLKYLNILIKVFQDGFYGYCEDEDHDKPYVFWFSPNNLALSDESIIAYWQESDSVYCEYPINKYGKKWALTEEELL